VHATLRLVPVVSGPEYVVDIQESTPESASVALPAIATGALNQPAPFGARAGAAAVSGGVASYLTSEEPEELFPALSVHVTLRLTPLVSGPL
jgi:hypothetical protein